MSKYSPSKRTKNTSRPLKKTSSPFSLTSPDPLKPTLKKTGPTSISYNPVSHN